MTTLYSSIIKLHALHSGLLSRDPGQWANAAFYGLIRQVDPPLAEALHRWNGRKPFTISTLGGLPQGSGPDVAVGAGWECWLRVTTLGQEIFQPFVHSFIRGSARPKLQLGPLTFGVAEVLTTPGAHPWAGYMECAETEPQLLTPEHIRLHFASPTAFNLGASPGSSAHFALFPHPALVFGSLAAKWRAFISPDLEVAYVEDIAADTRVSDYHLQTQTLHWKGRIQKGFTGRCTFNLYSLADDDRRLLASLADFAFYAGVGGKTTQGMGQCRVVN